LVKVSFKSVKIVVELLRWCFESYTYSGVKCRKAAPSVTNV